MKLCTWQEVMIDALNEDNEVSRLKELVLEDNPKRIAAYQNNKQQSLKQCLRRTYPTCVAILGDDCFNTIAHQYVSNMPMTTRDMNQYGEKFDQALQHLVLSKEAFETFEYLPELASLEWLLQLSYHAKNRVNFDFRKLAKLNESQRCSIVPLLADDVFILITAHPVFEVWKKHQLNLPELSVSNWSDKFHLCIFREKYQSQVERIDATTYQLLSHISEGFSLSEMVGRNLDIEQLPNLIERGWVNAFK